MTICGDIALSLIARKRLIVATPSSTPALAPREQPAIGASPTSPSPVMPTAAHALALPVAPSAPLAPAHVALPPRGRAEHPSTLHDELAVLDHARAAMAAGDPARTLAVMDDYARRFPDGSMAAEATVLRIEALLGAGNRSSARRCADPFLARAPDSVYVARIESLLSSTNR